MAATRSRLLLLRRFQTLRSLSTNSAAEAKMPQLQREIEIDIEHEERVKPARKEYEEIRRWCKENNAMINAIQKAAVKVIADRPRWNLPKDPKERAAKVKQWMVAIDESSMTMEQKLNDKIELEILQTQRKDDAKLEQLMREIDESNNWLLRRWARKRDLLHKLEDEDEKEAQPQLADQTLVEGDQRCLVEIDKKHLTWNNEKDLVLIDSLLDQMLGGQKIGGSFTSSAYGAASKAVSTKFSVHCDSNHVRNRLKTLKSNLAMAKDMLATDSGFRYNHSTQLIEATTGVWAAYLKAKPKASHFQHAPIQNFQKLCQLFEEDRATGSFAVGPKEK
ncbi:hypothetical protein CsSME_00020331 [Camellia sinensis var. sinensis]|uniref:uncharacterized protein LOC114300985 isoform X1 n=1 Tax=Camellia sinensis TaxID=4442 RepID=UPI001036765E|nr:uncharacterized protein LOC114300985 isoform X1 [Camellia sinensis]